MANDIDMWNDIEDLEKLGRKKKADELLKIYVFRFIEYDLVEAERLKSNFEKKYKDRLNYW